MQWQFDWAPTNTTDACWCSRTLNQFVARPLMISFAMIVGDKLRDRSTKMTRLPDEPVGSRSEFTPIVIGEP
jgi:hypothetical protein